MLTNFNYLLSLLDSVKKRNKIKLTILSNKVTYVSLFVFLLSLFSVNNLFTQNTCATAVNATVNASGTGCSNQTNVFTVGSDAANPLGSTAPCTIASTYERWIQFTAVGPTATVNVTQTSAASAVRQLAVIVYSGSCGSLTQIGCSNSFTTATVQTESLTLSGLTIGSTYYIRIINETNNTTLNTTTCITSIPGNDEPSGAFPLAVNNTSVCTPTQFNNYFATNSNCSPSIPNPSCSSYVPGTSQDVWYSVVVPASGNLVVNNSGQPYGLALYSGTNSPGCGSMTEVICAETGGVSNPSNFAGFSLTGLTPGTYYLRAWRKAGGTNTFSLCATSVPITPPANDEPCGATVAVVNTGTACTTSNTTSLQGATVTSPTPSCAGLSSGVQFTDVWTQFTATANTHSISVTGVSTPSAATTTNKIFVAVYATISSTCTSGVAIAGSELLCGSATASVVPFGYSVSGLTVGQKYLIRFFNWSAPGYSNTITYCITTPTISLNDECSSAVATVTNSGTSCASFTTGTVSGMTASSQTNGCGVGDDDDDAWYSFVAGSTSHSITITNTAGSDLYHSVYAGTCGSLGPAIMCSDPNNSILYGLTVGNTYYVRVYSTGSSTLSASNGTFDICINTPTQSATCFTPASDNFCPNPTSLSQSAYTFTGTVGAPPAASGIYTSDVPSVNLPTVFGASIEGNSWYSFIATATSHTFNIIPSGGCTIQARVLNVALTGSCCTSFTSMSNFFSSSSSGTITAVGLTIGNTYYLMVDGTSTTNCSFSIPTWVLSSTLPLEYISFTGNTEGRINVLEWITASENSKSKFTLEHSRNGIEFEDLVTLNGKGSSTGGVKYVANDENPYEDITYYRIRHNDNSLSEKYSNIISINLKNKYNVVTNIHPNPTTSDLNFEYYSKFKNVINIELMDYSGKIILLYTQPTEIGKNEMTLPLHNLDKGVYILKVASDKTSSSFHKIIKN